MFLQTLYFCFREMFFRGNNFDPIFCNLFTSSSPFLLLLCRMKLTFKLGLVVHVIDRMYVTAVMSSKGHASPLGFRESIGRG